jgi:MYXO-CTERM domain-containing protein
MNRRIPFLAALTLGLGVSCAALAAPIVPQFHSFGPLPQATFGGTGIPNDRVAVTSEDTILLALSVSPRYAAPAVADNGAGVFTVQAGVSPDAPSPADPHALWNFNYFVSGVTQNLTFVLLYDFDPGAATDALEHGRSTAPGALIPNPAQDSLNLGMDFLAAAVPGIEPPALAAFDPNAEGEYSFALVAYTALGLELARVAIQVNVLANRVPEPGALLLAGAALLAAGRRRRT